MDYTDFIERYLEKEMTSEELVWFEKEFEGNTILKQDIEFHKKVNAVLADTDSILLKQQLEAIHQELVFESPKKERKLRKLSFGAVAIAAVVIGLFVYTANRNYSNEKIVTAFYEPIDAHVNYRTVTDADRQLNKAIALYDAKQYEEALVLFESILAADVEMIGVNIYVGVSYMETGKYEKAYQSFSKIIEQEPNPFAEPAKWYLGMAYLSTGKTDLAKLYFVDLADGNGFYKKRAKKVLRHLK